MSSREKKPEDAYLERETDFLEKNGSHDQREEQEEEEGDCSSGVVPLLGPLGAWC